MADSSPVDLGRGISSKLLQRLNLCRLCLKRMGPLDSIWWHTACHLRLYVLGLTPKKGI